MAEIVISVTSKVAEYLVAPVGRQCGYVIFTNSYVGQLDKELEKLDDVRVEVQRSVDHADNNMWEIKREVIRWKNNAETFANKARGMLDNDGRAKKTCFCGWLPNPKGRYCLGRDARKTAQAIQELIPQGKFERVYYESAPPGLVGGAAEVNSSACDGGDTIQELIARGQFEKVDFENPPSVLVGGASGVNSSAGDGGDFITGSRASIFQDIMKALDDEKLKVIGVYGPGGVGKTTLLKEVEKKLREAGRPFCMIVEVRVSQIPDLNNIRDQIADALGLDLKDKQSPQGKADVMSKRLKSNPDEKVLIIFDDLWVKLDLEMVGIPWRDVSSKCKLLLTSRFKDVLEQEMGADRTFLLQVLKNDEAFGLFEKTVGDRLKDNEELKSIAGQLVKKLAGLPLLIVSIASTLKSSDESAWRNALIEIDDSNKEKKETIVRLSYDHLKSEDAKYLFLLCGLIGGTIRVELLFVLAMGLGLFERFNKTIQDSRDRLNNMLNELRSACLLLDGGNDKDNVTIHDLYNEVVVSDAFSDQNSLMINNNYGSWPKEKLEKCWACLVNVGSDRLAELMLRQFPHVKILMLSEQNDIEDCSRIDFAYMEELRVLYLNSMRITSLPSSMEILGNLRSLSIHCHVEDVANLGKLKALQILSFAGSTISRLPKEIGELTNLRSLNLSPCYSLQIIEPGALKGLINLEELLMKHSFTQWMGKHEIPSESCGAKFAELKSLTKLASLEIWIHRPMVLLEDSDPPFGNLVRFWIKIGFGSATKFKNLRIMELKLEGCNNILSREWVLKALQKTQYLHLSNLSEFKKSVHELCTQGFRELKDLDVDDSPSIKYIANSSDGLPLTAFVKLESLSLDNLINLEKIYQGPIAPECFSKLKVVSVRQCDRLKYLWGLSDMQRLVQLEEIEVRNCGSMQSIITHDAGEDIVSANNKIELPNVRRLVLEQLPNMMSFCMGVEITSEDTPIQVLFPRLESLVMVGLLGLEKILYSQPSFEYSNLKSVETRDSKCAVSIMKTDWILKMPNLESLEVVSSQSTEVFFDLEDLKVTGRVQILSRLMELTLRELPNLKRMWKRDAKLLGILTFQNLRKLEVANTGLAFLFPVSVAKCLREIKDIVVRDCPNMKAVIVDEEGKDEGIHDIIEFPLLESLRILRCPIDRFFSYPLGKKEPIATTSDSQYACSDSLFDQKVSLPSLECLSLYSVGSFKRVWHSELPRSFLCELADLTLDNCLDILNVFPSTMIGRLHNLKSVQIESCPSLESESLFDCGSLDSNIEKKIVWLPKLESVYMSKAGRLRHVVKSDSRTVLGFPSLRTVYVSDCLSLETLFDCGSPNSNVEVLLPKLESVYMSKAGRLRHVVKSDSQTVLVFPSLNSVDVDSCSELRCLFPKLTATSLEKLKTLYILNCEQMKQVIPKKEGGLEADVMSFPSLTEIVIKKCCNLGAFIQSSTSVKRQLGETAEENDESQQPFFNEMVRFPNITRLFIGDVQCKELWNNQIPTDSFCKLERLYLENCDNLRRIAPSRMWKRLQCCLKILIVESCHSIEIIYESDGTITKSDKLAYLNLSSLENIRHIWQHDGLPDVPFPNLSFIRASHCPRLEILFPTLTAEFLGQIKMLQVQDCENMELIAGHREYEEATGTTVIFSKLTKLGLENLPKFRSYLSEKYSAEFPLMEQLYVHSCGTESNQGEAWWLAESDTY